MKMHIRYLWRHFMTVHIVEPNNHRESGNYELNPELNYSYWTNVLAHLRMNVC